MTVQEKIEGVQEGIAAEINPEEWEARPTNYPTCPNCGTPTRLTKNWCDGNGWVDYHCLQCDRHTPVVCPKCKGENIMFDTELRGVCGCGYAWDNRP